MYSFISVINESSHVISVFCDDEPLFLDVIPHEKSKPKRVLYGCVNTIVKNGREKVLYDLWLPVKKETSHNLTVWDTSCKFT